MEITGGSNCWEARRKVVTHLEVYEESNDVRTPEASYADSALETLAIRSL